jgi:protein-S-isoprenylcysteine O-methyltransferase Ste14
VFVYAFTPALDVAHISLHALVRWSGSLLGILGIALLIATHRALGRNWSGQLEIADSHRLVVAGPYRRIRHPMYTAIFCMALAPQQWQVRSRRTRPLWVGGLKQSMQRIGRRSSASDCSALPPRRNSIMFGAE